MFALRGIAVSLSVFVTVYCVLSLSVSLTWRKVRALSQSQPVPSRCRRLACSPDVSPRRVRLDHCGLSRAIVPAAGTENHRRTNRRTLSDIGHLRSRCRDPWSRKCVAGDLQEHREQFLNGWMVLSRYTCRLRFPCCVFHVQLHR